MRTTLTAALAAAALAGLAPAQEPAGGPVKTDSTKPAAKKITIEDVGRMLQDMGYEPKPTKDKEGKVGFYTIEIRANGSTYHCYVDLAPNGQFVWLSCLYARVDKEPVAPEVLLVLLEQSRVLYPAFVTYFSNGQVIEFTMPVPTADLSPAALRKGLDNYTGKVQQLITAVQKAAEAAKAKKEKEEGKKDAPGK